jgi:hypothetical protein
VLRSLALTMPRHDPERWHLGRAVKYLAAVWTGLSKTNRRRADRFRSTHFHTAFRSDVGGRATRVTSRAD